MDVVLEFRSGQTWVAEIKRSSVSEGRYTVSTDLGATRRVLVAPVDQPYLPYEIENRSHEPPPPPCGRSLEFIQNLEVVLRSCLRRWI